MKWLLNWLRQVCTTRRGIRRLRGSSDFVQSWKMELRVLLSIDTIALPGVEFHDITGDSVGRLFVSGTVSSGSVDINPGPGVKNVSGHFIASYSSSGDLLWVRQVDFRALRLVAGPGGALWMTGSLVNNSTPQTIDADPNAGIVNLTKTATHQSFLIKWTTKAQYAASSLLPGDLMGGIDVSPTGEVAVIGRPPLGTSGQVTKFSATGAQLWTAPVSDYLYEYGGSASYDHISFDPTGAIVAATSEGLAKFTSDGALLWRKYQYQLDAMTGSHLDIYALDVAPDQTITIGLGGYNYNSVPRLIRLTPEGTLTFSQDMTESYDYREPPTEIETDASGRIYWTDGQFGGVSVMNDAGELLGTVPAPQYTRVASYLAASGEVFTVASDGYYYYSGPGMFADRTLASGAFLYSRNPLAPAPAFPMIVGSNRPPIYGEPQGGYVQLSVKATNATGDFFAAGFRRGVVDLDSGIGQYLVGDYLNVYTNYPLIAKYNQAEQIQWAHDLDGQVGFTDVVTLPQGGVQIHGTMLGSVDFDPGPNTFTLTSTGDSTPFTWTLNADGTLASAVLNPIGDFRQINRVITSANGDQTIIGYYQVPFDADPGVGVHMVDISSLYQEYEYNGLYIVQLNAAGEFQWVRSFTTTTSYGDDFSPSVQVLDNGSVVLVGTTRGRSKYRDGGTPLALNRDSTFMIRWSATGVVEWFHQFDEGSISLETAEVDSTGRILLSGQTRGFTNPDFDFGPNQRYLLAAENSPAVGVVAEYTPSGELNWGTSYRDGSRRYNDYGARARATRMADGRVVLAGTFYNSLTVETPQGPKTLQGLRSQYPANYSRDDSFVAILDPQGQFLDLWNYQRADESSYSGVYDLHTVGSRLVYASGQFQGTVDFNPAPDRNDMRGTVNNGQMAFITRFAAGPLVVPNLQLKLVRNSLAGTVVGQVQVPGAVTEDKFQFSIMQNVGNAFAIDPASGAITLVNPAAIPTAATSVTLRVRVADDFVEGSSTEIDVIVSLANAGQNVAPIVANASVRVSELLPSGGFVGQLPTFDLEGDSLTWTIIAGNTGSVFAIEATTGRVTVAPGKVINFETRASYALTLRVQDAAGNAATGTLTVTVINEVESTLTGGLIVPLYKYPVTAPNTLDPYWEAVRTSATVNNPITVVVNPASGPNATGADLDNYKYAIERLRSNQYIRILGYVPTGYGVRPSDDVLADVNTYGNVFRHSLTGASLIDGVFLDEMSTSPQYVGKYAAIRSRIKASTTLANTFLVGNWGVATPEAYQASNTADVYLVYEDIAAKFNSLVSGYSGGYVVGFGVTSFAAIVHGVATATEMEQVVDNAYTWGFEYVFVTDDTGANPYDTIPAYWTTLRTEVRAPYSSEPILAASVNENSPVGTVVTQHFSHYESAFLAKDPDAGQQLTYTIVSGNIGGAFSINPVTGELKVANTTPLNYEVNPKITLTIRVTDNSPLHLTDTFKIAVSLVNMNEAAILSNATYFAPEDVSDTTPIGKLVITDPDTIHSYYVSITAGNIGNAFYIRSDGNIYRNWRVPLDFETRSVYTLTVTLEDHAFSGTVSLFGSNFTTTATITIRLTNVNEAPRIANQTFSIAENSPLNATVGQVAATDPDASTTLTYSITAGNVGNAFAISSSGKITVATPAQLNYEQRTSFTLTVRVQDNGNPSLSSSATVTVDVLNVNDPPTFAGSTVTLAENSVAGTLVTTVSATDEDPGQSRTYSIASGNIGGVFAINAVTGAISVANPLILDFETRPSITLQVRALDDGSPAKSTTVPVIINLTNVDEAPAVLNQAFTIPEFTSVGILVGTVVGSDPEGATLTWSIISGNIDGAFTIDVNTGAITVANSLALNYALRRRFMLTVRASDSLLTKDSTITINLTDVL